MGNCQSCRIGGRAWRPAPASREITLLLLGLDGAGKSTVLANLLEESTEDVLPTIGFANATATIANCSLKLFDVGGGPRIRGIWKNYYPQAHGVIFVVDAASPERLDESKQVLGGVLRDEMVKGKPLVILANKQDQVGALSPEGVRERLGLDTLLENQQQQHIRVVGCVGVCEREGERSGRRGSVRREVGRVVREVRGRLGELGERVRRDTERQKEQQEREREERKERVRRIREERERQVSLQSGQDGTTSKDMEGEGENTPINPFKPISEAVAEATEREARAKELKKKRKKEDAAKAESEGQERDGEEGKEREGGGEEGEGVKQVEQPITAAHTKHQSQRGTEEGSTDNGSPALSSVSSGLSTSSSSLTHVTVPSKEEETSLLSESLGPPQSTTPPSESVAMATTRQHPEGVGERAEEQQEVKKVAGRSARRPRRSKMGKFNFLSRLKNRSRIAPSTQSITATTSAELPSGPVSSVVPQSLSTTSNVATTNGRDHPSAGGHLTAHPTTSDAGSPVANRACQREKEREKESAVGVKITVPEDGDDVFRNLPELPKTRGTLPPVQVHKRLPGLEEQTFTTSQDIIYSQ